MITTKDIITNKSLPLDETMNDLKEVERLFHDYGGRDMKVDDLYINLEALQQSIKRETTAAEKGITKVSPGKVTELREDRKSIGHLIKKYGG